MKEKRIGYMVQMHGDKISDVAFDTLNINGVRTKSELKEFERWLKDNRKDLSIKRRFEVIIREIK